MFVQYQKKNHRRRNTGVFKQRLFFLSFSGDRSVIQMIINEMYALNGYKFQDEDLKNYYEKQDWYNKIESKTTDMAEIYRNMSKTEQDNIKLLKEYK